MSVAENALIIHPVKTQLAALEADYSAAKREQQAKRKEWHKVLAVGDRKAAHTLHLEHRTLLVNVSKIWMQLVKLRAKIKEDFSS